jgi:FixJ family two-component response regulator
MDLLPQPSSNTDAREVALARAEEQLQELLKALKEARRVLRRDWEQMTPRERSTQSRVVKELEHKKVLLEDEIEMNNA